MKTNSQENQTRGLTTNKQYCNVCNHNLLWDVQLVRLSFNENIIEILKSCNLTTGKFCLSPGIAHAQVKLEVYTYARQ